MKIRLCLNEFTIVGHKEYDSALVYKSPDCLTTWLQARVLLERMGFPMTQLVLTIWLCVIEVRENVRHGKKRFSHQNFSYQIKALPLPMVAEPDILSGHIFPGISGSLNSLSSTIRCILVEPTEIQIGQRRIFSVVSSTFENIECCRSFKLFC